MSLQQRRNFCHICESLPNWSTSARAIQFLLADYQDRLEGHLNKFVPPVVRGENLGGVIRVSYRLMVCGRDCAKIKLGLLGEHTQTKEHT